MTETKPKLRVAIIGAGIGGLTLAVALKSLDKYDNLDLDVYEGAPTISEVGAGINLWPRSWEILKNIGLEAALLDLIDHDEPLDAGEQVVFHIRKSDQREGYPIRDLMMKGGSLRFHRAELQRVLLAYSGGHIHLAHRLVSYTETGECVHLEFQGGLTKICDVLIGMDGINSVTRKIFLRNLSGKAEIVAEPVWSGTLAYRGLVTHDAINNEYPGHRASCTPVMYCGKNKHIVVYPLSLGRLTNVVAFVTDPSKEGTKWNGPSPVNVHQDELLSKFAGWEDEAQALLRCLESPGRWAVHDLTPLKQHAHGRVVLAGDAAHAMVPHQGAGAGQAIEDAYMLATLLTHENCNKGTLIRLGEVYNAVRCPASNAVLLASRIQGKWCELDAPGFADIKEGDEVPGDQLNVLFGNVARAWDWVWATSADDDCKKALEMMYLKTTTRVPKL